MGKNVTTVECRSCKSRVTRICASDSDRDWLCPDCDPSDALQVPSEGYQDALGGDLALDMRGDRLPDGFHEVRPAALANSAREYPAWTQDETQWNQVVARLSRRKDGTRTVAIAYWYWRVGMSARHIAGTLDCSLKTVRVTLERLRKRFGSKSSI